MPSYCLDEVLTRAFASESTQLSSSFDNSNPNIRDFDRFTTTSVDNSVPDPFFYLLADCRQTHFVVSEVEIN